MTPVHFPGTPSWLWWAHPWAFALLLLIPLLWWLWGQRGWRAAIRYSTLVSLRASGAGEMSQLRRLLPILRTAALACLIVGVARPQEPDETSRTFAEGIAIQLVVDTSSSMYDFDLAPRGARMTRLDVVKDVLSRFVHGDDDLPGRKNDLIGIVTFARYADSICPLTLDHQALQEALDQVHTVQPNSSEDGTAIGDGLGLAVERLRELKRTTGSGEQIVITSRAVILLTDGENNAGMLAPEQAGELAATYGIKVYTILAGTGRKMALGGRLPVDDSALRDIAAKSGGQFFEARDAESLVRIYEAIDQMERTRVEERTHLAWGELSRPWLIAAFSLIALQSLLDATWLRKIP